MSVTYSQWMYSSVSVAPMRHSVHHVLNGTGNQGTTAVGALDISQMTFFQLSTLARNVRDSHYVNLAWRNALTEFLSTYELNYTTRMSIWDVVGSAMPDPSSWNLLDELSIKMWTREEIDAFYTPEYVSNLIEQAILRERDRNPLRRTDIKIPYRPSKPT